MNKKLIAELKNLFDQCEKREDRVLWDDVAEILSRHEAEQGEGLGEQIVCAGCGHGDFYLNTSGMVCCKACGKQRSETVGIYSGNCRFNVGVCILPEKEPCRMGFISRCHGRIGKNPTPTKPTEPLAVLADRKGVHDIRSFKLSNGEWTIYLDGYKIMYYEVFSATYAAAEAKARAYLMALEDKEGV